MANKQNQIKAQAISDLARIAVQVLYLLDKSYLPSFQTRHLTFTTRGFRFDRVVETESFNEETHDWEPSAYTASLVYGDKTLTLRLVHKLFALDCAFTLKTEVAIDAVEDYAYACLNYLNKGLDYDRELTVWNNDETANTDTSRLN